VVAFRLEWVVAFRRNQWSPCGRNGWSPSTGIRSFHLQLSWSRFAALRCRRGDRLLDVKQVAERTTLVRATIWELERAGHFPRRRQVTANKVAWLESEVEAWIASRPTVQESRETLR